MNHFATEISPASQKKAICIINIIIYLSKIHICVATPLKDAGQIAELFIFAVTLDHGRRIQTCAFTDRPVSMSLSLWPVPLRYTSYTLMDVSGMLWRRVVAGDYEV